MAAQPVESFWDHEKLVGVLEEIETAKRKPLKNWILINTVALRRGEGQGNEEDITIWWGLMRIAGKRLKQLNKLRKEKTQSWWRRVWNETKVPDILRAAVEIFVARKVTTFA
jgi:hypothetical protein